MQSVGLLKGRARRTCISQLCIQLTSGTELGPLSFCTYPQTWLILYSQSLPLHEPLAMTFDPTTLKSCPLSSVFKSLMCHQEFWKLLSPAYEYPASQFIQLAHFPLSLPAHPFPPAVWSEPFLAWSSLLCFLVREEAQSFQTDFSVLC